jgi:hypothetical protein
MGDRFSFGVTDRDGDVLYLYSHWGGGDWDTNLKQALWESGTQSNSYERANRIVMSWLIGDGWDSKSGYAISINRPSDTEYGFIPVVDFRHNKITFYEYDKGRLGHKLVELSIIQYLNCINIQEVLDWTINEHNEIREILDVTL